MNRRLIVYFFLLCTAVLRGQSSITNTSAQAKQSYTIKTLSKKSETIGTVLISSISKVNYFVSGDPFARWYAWNKSNRIMATFSAAYMNEEGPIGLSIDRGTILSKSIHPEMDGLVIIDTLGNCTILDISGSVALQNSKDRTYSLNTSAIDRLDFLAFLSKHKYSVFQTHLLSNHGQLKIGSNTSGKTAERRIFAQAKKGDKPFQFLINIDQALPLLEASILAMHNLSEYTELTMVNLDVGTKDILRVYDSQGMEKSRFNRGSLLKANNLMVVYAER